LVGQLSLMRRGGFGKTSDGRVSHTVPVTDRLVRMAVGCRGEERVSR
jgi:hypothetical protein